MTDDGLPLQFTIININLQRQRQRKHKTNKPRCSAFALKRKKMG
jgi:hypothetical protein